MHHTSASDLDGTHDNNIQQLTTGPAQALDLKVLMSACPEQ